MHAKNARLTLIIPITGSAVLNDYRFIDNTSRVHHLSHIKQNNTVHSHKLTEYFFIDNIVGWPESKTAKTFSTFIPLLILFDVKVTKSKH